MLAKELSFQVDRRPFIRQPDHPPEGMPRRQFDGETETELSPEMRERAKSVGLVMRRPHWSPNALRAHEVTAYAKERGKDGRSEEHTSELQSRRNLVCRLLLEKKKQQKYE